MDPKTDKLILIDEVVEKLKYFVKLYGVESLFIVGGFCREHYFDALWRINDIDVASAFHEQALQIAGLFASEVLNVAPKFYKRSGAAVINYKSELGEIKIEFQGDSVNRYMYNADVKDYLHQIGVEDVPLNSNIYGRDFTMNTLIYSLAQEKFFDPTQRAISDLERKKIVPVLPAQLLVKYNPLVIFRAIRFAMLYDFIIDPELREAMKNGQPKLEDFISKERILKEIVRILIINGPKGLEFLKEFSLDRFLLDPLIKDYLNVESKE